MMPQPTGLVDPHMMQASQAQRDHRQFQSKTGVRVSSLGPTGALRIALTSYRSKPHCGGQGVYVRHLSRELVALGHRVEVFSGPPYLSLIHISEPTRLGMISYAV